MKRQRPRVRIWPAPIALAVLTAVGLVAALLSEQSGDVLSWFALAAPALIALWYSVRGRRLESAARAENEHG